MTAPEQTIWDKLVTCVNSLTPPIQRSEIVSWFRRHHPEVQEQSLGTHIQAAISNVPTRSAALRGRKEPLLTRIGHGTYVRYDGTNLTTFDRSAADADPRASDNATSTEVEWFTEAHVQSRVVTHLASEGWNILSVADTASKQRGLDIAATRDGQRVGVEVKGYPSRHYVDPARRHEIKPTQPSSQAVHWFAGAVLSAMRLRTREPETLSVIALPDTPRYRTLHAETRGSLDATGIQVWFCHQDGAVEVNP